MSKSWLTGIENLSIKGVESWVYFCFALNLLLLADLVIHVIFYGPRAIWKLKYEYVYEGVLQIITTTLFIIYEAYTTTHLEQQIKCVEAMALVLLFRLPIIGVLLMEINDFAVIIETTKRMFSPFATTIFSMYLVIFAWNAVGIVAWSGVVKLSSIADITNSSGSGLYYMLNFNDTISGMLTLFSILVSNNWNSTTDMYGALTGSDFWPRFYFSSFFLVSIFIILNIIISFVIEIYTMALEDMEKKWNKHDMVKTVMKVAPTQEALEDLIRKAKLFDKLHKKLSMSSEGGSPKNGKKR